LKTDIIYNKSSLSMKEIPDNSIDCIVTDSIMKTRDKKGRFIKGIHYSPQTEFKKGQHWRKPKLYWDKNWLENEYKNKSANQIAREQKCTVNNILYFIKKFGIKTRTMQEIRKRKYWGLPGKMNPMYGRIGRLNPNWNGGHSPERQSKYARYFWKELAKSILKRDNYRCQDCNAPHNKNHKLIVHHIKEWSKYPKLRFETSNLITLCESCHKKRHKGGEFSPSGD